MRPFVIPYCWLTLALSGIGSRLAVAEVIHLKNGDVIYADRAKETETQVQYEVGDNTYTIPKSRVQSIEQAAVAVSRPSPLTTLPTYVPSGPSGDHGELLGQIIHGGQVNREALAAIESHGNPSETAIAFYVAARQEFQDGKYSEARRDFETALRQDPRNPAVLNYYAALLVRTGDPGEALSYAERAVQLAPDSADAFAVLGYAQFASAHLKEAILSLKHSLALRPDSSIQQLLGRAEREAAAESNYSERDAGHFVLRYEGKQSSEGFRRLILSTLEADYGDLTRDFGIEPRSSIQIVLYTNQDFFDVTRAPSWTGAINDGKLRIPLQGLDSVTPDLARILKHELAHSFVNQLAAGRCPHWLNEGIAQMLEPASLAPRGSKLAELFKLEREIPLNSLEGAFMSFSGQEAALAYDESLATVEYMRASFGMSDVLGILERLARGESVESAMRATIHCDYRQLQGDVGAYLLHQFGS